MGRETGLLVEHQLSPKCLRPGFGAQPRQLCPIRSQPQPHTPVALIQPAHRRRFLLLAASTTTRQQAPQSGTNTSELRSCCFLSSSLAHAQQLELLPAPGPLLP